jgi:cytochrome P450
MSRLTDIARFGASLHLQRAQMAFHGYLRGDPMAQLLLRPGWQDPYPVYERLRATGPIAPTRLGNWVTTGHPETSQVLRDRRVGVRAVDGPAPQAGMDLSFLERDPPDHTRLRRLAAPAFSPRQMTSYRPRIEQVAADLVDRAAGRDGFDLVSDIAAPLPIAVITDLLGIPDADAAEFARYGATIGGALDGVRSLRHARALMIANARLEQMFDGLFELRRHEPADDLISRLVSADHVRIQPAELVPICVLLLIAGFETTVNLIGNAIHALLDHPEQWQALRHDPALAPRVVEETLRFDAPVQRTARVALEPLEIGGASVAPGQWVLTLIGAANRDPAVYPRPAVFDITRDHPAEHLAFSSGIHYCLGAPLARLEAEVALATVAERLDLVRSGRVTRRRGGTIRGLRHLPVRTRAARRSRHAAVR